MSISLQPMAAKADQDVLRVVYQTFSRSTVDMPVPKETVRILDMQGEKSIFFEMPDSTRKDAIPQDNWNITEFQYGMRLKFPPYVTWGGIEPYVVAKNMDGEASLTFASGIIYRYNYYYREDIPQMDWEMLDADSVVCGYVCQKARTVFRGRTWTVWYAPELPYNDGPWKLCGLPGLILKANDANGDFSFTAYKVSKSVVPFPTEVLLKGYKKTTIDNFIDDLCHSLSDYEEFFQMLTGVGGGIYDANGRQIKSPSRTACLMEYPERAFAKKKK